MRARTSGRSNNMDDTTKRIQELTKERDEALQLANEACARLDLVTTQHELMVEAIRGALEDR